MVAHTGVKNIFVRFRKLESPEASSLQLLQARCDTSALEFPTYAFVLHAVERHCTAGCSVVVLARSSVTAALGTECTGT